MKEFIKKNKIVSFLFLIGVICFITGVSYAFFYSNFLGISDNQLTIGQNLIFRYDETGNALNLTNSDMISDDDGKTSTKYFDFEVSQTTDVETATPYYIYLTKDDTSNLSDNNIKIYLTDQSNNSLTGISEIGNLEIHEIYENSYYLYGTSITTNGTTLTHKYRLRVWVDEDVSTTITEEDGVHTLERVDYTYKFTVNVATGGIPTNLDQSGANVPVLASNMIPVYYDGTNWVKADSSNMMEAYRWYSYSDKIWANAVTVTSTNRDTYLKAKEGTPIAMSDINTMWVWIPRFSATKNGSYNGGKKSAPGAFNITFVDKNTNAHDAFTFGEEVSGFWIGKFENSSDTTCIAADYSAVGTGCNLNTIRPKIIPNETSWRGAMVSTYFYDILAMTDNGNQYGFNKTIDVTLDTHMIKNSEWGAVAYLTQSIYGRCTASTSCTEVGINNNSSYITGYGAPAGSNSSVANGTYETTLGMNASTTGNIYGVYDMNGGAYEYVMGAYWNGTKLWSGGVTTTNYNSGFNGCLGSGCSSTLQSGVAYPSDGKYYNLYTTYTNYLNAGLQHAMEETSGWYNDRAHFVGATLPWVFRSGYYNGGHDSGIFYFFDAYGYSYISSVSRSSITIN